VTANAHGKKAILVTGVSSGIGLGIARKLLGSGFRVFGSVRSKEQAENLSSRLGADFTPLVFDICKQEQLVQAEQELSTALGESGLFAVVNNAGSAEIGPLLHVPPEDVLRQLDTLVVGQLRVVQTFVRHLRTGPLAPGRIVNISSVSGVGSNYLFGAYAAGKHGLEGLSKTLREELRRFGIKVVVVAPGNIATDIWPKQTSSLADRYRGTEYEADLEGALAAIATTTVKNAMSVEEFCDALYDVITTKNPADRYTVLKSRRRHGPLRRFSRVKVRVLPS
jgi:NAD(P)-dependent dehydrogenase (short-subunit alcohol dehydrogenase family)